MEQVRKYSWVLLIAALPVFVLYPGYRLSVVAGIGLIGAILALVEGRLPIAGKRSVTYVYTGREARLFAAVLVVLFAVLFVVGLP